MTQQRLLMAASLALTTLCSVGLTSAAPANAGPLSNLEQQLALHQVEGVKILLIPNNVVIDAHVDEGILQQVAVYSCDVTLTPRQYSDLTEAIMNTRTSRGDDSPDISWGVGFYDYQGRKISQIYLSTNWSNLKVVQAKIDGQVVNMNKPFIGWLEKNFPSEACSRVQAAQ